MKTIAYVSMATFLGTILTAWVVGNLRPDEYKSGIVWPSPPVVDPGSSNQPPSDAVVLFDGTDLSQWQGGEPLENRRWNRHGPRFRHSNQTVLWRLPIAPQLQHEIVKGKGRGEAIVESI